MARQPVSQAQLQEVCAWFAKFFNLSREQLLRARVDSHWGYVTGGERTMQVRRAVVGLAVAGLALAVVGCSSGSNEVVEGTGITEAAETKPIPDRVAVHRPAWIDTDISPDDVPVWPGPHPSEFLMPTPPAGTSGEIARAHFGT